MNTKHIDDSVDTGLQWAVQHVFQGEIQTAPPPGPAPRGNQLQVLLHILQETNLIKIESFSCQGQW